jgi:N-acetylglucosaminyldiphosphoundecaprenol N-acetyl-beta-D-mannosaminyltransferase
MSAKYPGVVFCGTNNGYFDKSGEENEKIKENIRQSGAEVLFVCFGAPAQEKWIIKNRGDLGGVKLMLGLGGSLDGYAGAAKRAPKLFIRLGLEWFYRLLCDPKRIGRMMKLPKFYLGTWKYKLLKK